MKYIITYFPEFLKNVLKELESTDKNINIKTKEIADNISLIETELDASEFTRSLLKSSPIFLRHIMPVLYKGDTTNEKEADCKAILNKAAELCGIKSGQFFSVQCRIVNGYADYKSKDVEVAVGSYFESIGAIPKFSDYEIINFDIDIISVLIDGSSYYIGFSKASENLNSHSDEYRIFSRSGRSISRAENKLKEAICKFNLSVGGNGRALDMGAAPGGWTKVLADYGYSVAAVDPAGLHESLRSHPNITHYKDRVENIAFDGKFEIITNDMNVDPQITARIMCSLAENLIENGLAVITLKLPFSDIDRSIKEASEILSEKYDILALKNLSHNRREITALIKVKRL